VPADDLYLDCFAGICGNMLLGALVDIGVDFHELQDTLASLPITGFDLTCERTQRAGIAATHVQVHCTEGHRHRRFKECCDIIDRSSLPVRVKEDATRVFLCLAEAEAAVHGIAIDEVHFHEVGAVDAIVDIVGACWASDRLKIRHVYHGPVNLGDGMVVCSHGNYPVPVPAVQRLLVERPTVRGIAGIPDVGELTTPTGAALVAALARPAAGTIVRTVTGSGYGAGDRNPADFPNCLRIDLVAAAASAARRETIVELLCDVDDSNPEWLPAAADAARAAGAVDVTFTPITGKEGRPATHVTALCSPDAAGAVEVSLFRHTTTFGVRRRELSRACLVRRWTPVETPFGPVRVKEGWLGDERLQASPEYRDCLACSRDHGVSIREVYRSALALLPPAGHPPTEDEAP